MSRARYVSAVIAPAAVVVIACALWSTAILPQLPNPTATHFTGLPMRADGWDAPVPSVALLAGVAVGMVVLHAFLAAMPGLHGAGARVLGAVMSSSTVLVALLLPVTLAPQVGLDDAADLVLPASSSVLMVVGAGVFGVIGALVPPPAAVGGGDGQPGAAPPVIDVPAGGATVWFGSGTLARVPRAILVGCAFAAVGTNVYVGVRGGGGVFTAVVSFSVAIAVLATAAFIRVRVRVDGRGIHWRMLVGVPRGTIPWDRVADVEVVDVLPGEWGGWGLRTNGDGWGVILREGEALRVRRTRGGPWVFTVDDADTAAAVARGHLGDGA